MYKFIFLLSSIWTLVQAQPYLTRQEAIARTLKFNYDIQLASVDVKIADRNAVRANAGFVPRVGVNAGGTRSVNDTRQRFVSGQEVNRQGAQSANLNGEVFLQWTLFDGGKMFTTYQKLQEEAHAARLKLQADAERAMVKLLQLYDTWVLQHQLIQAQTFTLTVSEERIKLSEARLASGKGNKLEVLQARMDKNAQLARLDELEQTKLQLLSELNVMQGLDIRTVYQPADTQLLKFETPFDSLRTLTLHRNRNLKVLEKNIALRQLELKAQKASAFPQISLNVSYGLNRLTNEAGFLLFNNTASLLGGITASWMLYDAGNLRRQTQNQLLMQARAQTEFDRQRTELEARLQIGWAHYLRQKQQVQREEENRAFSIDAMEIAMERYRIGSSSTLELMLVQQEVTQAESRLAHAKHNCNQAVIQLLALDGSLMIPE